MKNLLVFHPSSELYGADRILVIAIEALAKDKNVTVFLPSDGPLKQFLLERVPSCIVKIDPKVPVIYRNQLKSPLLLLMFIRNLIHINQILKAFDRRNTTVYLNTLSVAFIGIFCRLNRLNTFIHVHEIIEKPKIIGWVTAQLAFLMTNKIICVSKAVESNLIKFVPEIGRKTSVLYNGIAPLSLTSKKYISKEVEKIKFYLFGRIKPEKGQWFLLDTLKTMPRELLVRAEFHIVGGTVKGQEHLLSDLKKIAVDSQLENFVKFHGFHSNINAFMVDADVCLIPSLMKDPFPTTVLEAMSASKVVITTNHGGAAEIISDRINGVLIEPNNTQDFSNAIRLLIENPFLIAQYGEVSKETYKENFGLQNFKNRISDFIENFHQLSRTKSLPHTPIVKQARLRI